MIFARLIQSYHLSIFITPEELRQFADSLDLKRTRTQSVVSGHVPANASLVSDACSDSVIYGDVIVNFRLPEERENPAL